ncbi:transcription antitermination factor NusB [Thioclava sp. GXIMD4216]|uniref:RsmB/NOP family class I SAM-dependent RNA methyltransferase n=1 Tax=Thioclava sp. GXIMD4216 TaxID=3131929 RepID=UPI0030CDFA2C
MAKPDPARRAALGLIVGVFDDHLSLADQIAMDALDGLSPGEKARAQRLATSTLRHMERADKMLKPFLKRKPTPDIMALLRLATVELCAEGGADHGVVDAAVTLCKSGGRRTDSFAGLVNAVLRKVAEDKARWETLPYGQLPGWLRGRLMSAYGKVSVQKMEEAHQRPAPVDISVKENPADWAERLEGEVLPTGSVRLHQPSQIRDLPGFAEGDWWVQDAAASLAAKALAPTAGMRVLDLCAAPGGKTLQLAAMGAQVTALDLSERRLARLHENLERCKLSAEVVAADALDWTPEAPFDAILLDAPCSATGTIRRHPELPAIKDSASIKGLFALQEEILERAMGWLTPEGRLTYVTCSLLPEEGETQIRRALERHPEWEVIRPTLEGIDPEWITEEGGLRLRPDYWADKGGMDGFYVATLKRRAE